MGYRLIVRDGGKKRTYPLTGEVVSVGRSTDNTIPIKENGSSRHHCQVSQQGEAFFVQDLGSRNGTLLNKKQITNQELEDGDVIQIGKTKIVFMADSGGAEPELELMPDSEEESPPSPSKRRRRTTRRRQLADSEAETRHVAKLDPDADSGGLQIEGEEQEKDGLLPGQDEPYYLIWFDGDEERPFVIGAAVTTIGRLSSNSIALGDEVESASGKHAQLSYEDGTFTLKDLGSTNGTKVNGIKITEHTLKAGDLVEFGRAHFVFRNESHEEDSKLSTMTGMEIPDYGASVTPVYASQGAPKFLLPFLGTFLGIVGIVGGLSFYAIQGSKPVKPKVAEIPDNLIPQYSFEDVQADKPIGWKLGGEGIGVREVGDAPSGKRVLTISHEPSDNQILAASFDQTIKVKRFLHYQVEAQIRHTQGQGYAALRIQWLSSKDPYYKVEDYVGMLPAAKGWKKVVGLYTAPAKADHARVACLAIGPVQGAEFDDVLLSESSKRGAPMPEALETPKGKVQLDRSGLVTIYRGSKEQVFTMGRLQVVDGEGNLIYDQAVMIADTSREGDSVTISGRMPHLQGGEAMDLKLTITRGEQGFSLAYALGDKKIEGANVRFLSAVGELDAASAMAVETEGKFEMIRGEFVRPQVSLFTWKGAEKHLGLYPESPYFLRYSKGTTVQLSLFSPMEDEHKLSFKLRLNFAEDKSAMDNAFKQAYALRDGGQMGESCRAFKQIIRRYPFIDGSSKARKSIERIEQEAVRELAKLRQGFVRGQHFNRSKMLMGVREDLMAYQKRFEGMAVLAQSKELTEQVKNALTSAKSREVEALANQLMQKAKDFREAQMNNLAITVYKRVIEQCAGTSQAEDAAKAIQELLPAEKGN